MCWRLGEIESRHVGFVIYTRAIFMKHGKFSMSSLTKQDFLGCIDVMKWLVPLDMPLCRLYGETIIRREIEDGTSEHTFRRIVKPGDGKFSDIAMNSLKGMSYNDLQEIRGAYEKLVSEIRHRANFANLKTAFNWANYVLVAVGKIQADIRGKAIRNHHNLFGSVLGRKDNKRSFPAGQFFCCASCGNLICMPARASFEPIGF
jgi:hypothetical protein